MTGEVTSISALNRPATPLPVMPEVRDVTVQRGDTPQGSTPDAVSHKAGFTAAYPAT